MARIKRIVIPNTEHHVTQRGVRSRYIFYKELLYKQYKKHEIKQQDDQRKMMFKINSYTVPGLLKF